MNKNPHMVVGTKTLKLIKIRLANGQLDMLSVYSNTLEGASSIVKGLGFKPIATWVASDTASFMPDMLSRYNKGHYRHIPTGDEISE